jgi:hypothetical protein
MKASKILPLLTILLVALSFVACKKPEPEPVPNIYTRKVSYEITGSYSGKLTVTYIKADGMKQTQTNISLPWSKAIIAAEGVTRVEFIAATPGTDECGKYREYAIATLFIDGNPKMSDRQNTDPSGHIQFKELFHTY